jgi:hypothetical protein
VGALAGAAGSLAMNVFTRIWTNDHRGHGVQPPQACEPGDDATVRAGTIAFAAATGDTPPATLREPLGAVAHYAFGSAMGIVYAFLAPRLPALRSGRGALYGALVWAGADEGLMPALGLSRGPRQLRARTHGYALAGHVIYGAAVHAVAAAVVGVPSTPARV